MRASKNLYADPKLRGKVRRRKRNAVRKYLKIRSRAENAERLPDALYRIDMYMNEDTE